MFHCDQNAGAVDGLSIKDTVVVNIVSSRPCSQIINGARVSATNVLVRNLPAENAEHNACCGSESHTHGPSAQSVAQIAAGLAVAK